jgi:hypothetical protein
MSDEWKKPKVQWPKMDWETRKKRFSEDALYAVVLGPARLVRRVKGECPPRAEVMAAFCRWAAELADEAFNEGKISRDMIESRELAYRRMSKEQQDACNRWAICHGVASLAELAEDVLRAFLLEFGAEIIEK